MFKARRKRERGEKTEDSCIFELRVGLGVDTVSSFDPFVQGQLISVQ